jgi:hypothetical protein
MFFYILSKKIKPSSAGVNCKTVIGRTLLLVINLYDFHLKGTEYANIRVNNMA